MPVALAATNEEFPFWQQTEPAGSMWYARRPERGQDAGTFAVSQPRRHAPHRLAQNGLPVCTTPGYSGFPSACSDGPGRVHRVER
jgi:hypothetical protein